MAESKSIKLSTEDMKWKAESDARTLQEAEVIRGDKKRIKAALKIMDEQMKAMQVAKETTMDAMADKMFPTMKKED